MEKDKRAEDKYHGQHKIIMQEIVEDTPPSGMTIYKEIKDILRKLNMHVEVNKDYKRWRVQGSFYAERHEQLGENKLHSQYNRGAYIKQDNLCVPVQFNKLVCSRIR